MYDNIGKKIKTLTKVVTIILICCCFIGFIIAGARASGEGAVIGILLGAVASLLIWVSSFFMYAFGELVDKVCDIEVNTRGSGSVCSKNEERVDADGTNSERNKKLRVLLEKGLISEEEYHDIISK